MEEIIAEYKKLPAEEGMWGNKKDGYIKHDFQVNWAPDGHSTSFFRSTS